MRGPEILARTMSRGSSRGTSAKSWQYHSRSDAHSKVACWCVLFDLLLECDVFRQGVGLGRVGFGINHVMVGPINKTLDLVVTRLSMQRPRRKRCSFVDLVETYQIDLNADDRALLLELPVFESDLKRDDVSEVAIALEAKACMTEHSKSLPRLHAEILATGFLARQASPQCITVSYSMINAAPEFVTPSKEGKTNRHSQPDDAAKVVEMISRALPRAQQLPGLGYDVIGVTVVNCRNDGSPVTLVDRDPAPKRDSPIHYERMITGLCGAYRQRFGNSQ
jgi:hypothetical protein